MCETCMIMFSLIFVRYIFFVCAYHTLLNFDKNILVGYDYLSSDKQNLFKQKIFLLLFTFE